ncbi:MAG: hypothetical protein WD118_05700 [Phycisphaeraceae bacterium]
MVDCWRRCAGPDKDLPYQEPIDILDNNAKVKPVNWTFASKDIGLQGLTVHRGDLKMTNCIVYNAKDGLTGWGLTASNRIEVKGTG